MVRRRLAADRSPAEAIAALDREDAPFLLESRAGGAWSFAGAWPTQVVEATDLSAVEAALAPHAARRLDSPPMPFAGGAVGFIAYDHARALERLPSRARRDQDFPDLRFGIYPHVLAFDHERGEWWVAGLEAGFEAAFARYEAALARPVEWPAWVGPTGPLERGFTPEAYERAVARAIEYILDGDIFEVNLSQRFSCRVAGAPLGLYRRVREHAPAPFAAYLRLDARRAVIASPERYLSVRGRRVTTEPIKGTRRRGASDAEDARLSAELLSSAKDRAELAMIVDLARNDLGRVAAPGTVRVRAAAELRSFATVHHLVGVVEADLAPGRTVFDALRASFPGGSITGAPKVRAMEIIDELEPTRRAVYTGAIGYVGFDRDADLNIAIRTILLDGDRATFQAGGAVTADSDPASELEETLAKARALARAIGISIDCHDRIACA